MYIELYQFTYRVTVMAHAAAEYITLLVHDTALR